MSNPKVTFQSTCPFCGSAKVGTNTNKKKSVSSYLHCGDCGQVWHPDRVRVSGIGRVVGR